MILDKIIAQKKIEIKNLNTLPSHDLNMATHDFLQALNAEHLSIIAEIKPGSPHHGQINLNYDPSEYAKAYTKAEVDAISVITDETFFLAHPQNVKIVREYTTLPILYKDIIIDEKQIHQARSLGADACLIVVAALDDNNIEKLIAETEKFNMTAIVEVFTQQELTRALQFSPKVIQINNRNLQNSDIDIQNANRLSQVIPDDITVIAASGINQPEDINAIDERIDAVLIGKALMQSTSPIDFIKQCRAQS